MMMNALAAQEAFFERPMRAVPDPVHDESRPPKLQPHEAQHLLERGPYVARLAAKRKLLAYVESTRLPAGAEGPELPDYLTDELKTEVRLARAALRSFEAAYENTDIAETVKPTMPDRQESHATERSEVLGGISMSTDVFNLYLQDVGRWSKLLTAEEEVELAKTIEAGLFAEKILTGEVKTGSDASVEELEWLADAGREAKQRFIESNLRLTVSIAKRYGRAATNAMKLEDMVQEGNIGLMHAIEKFDYQKGFKFSTYSTWWIKQSVGRSISMQARAIRIPIHRMEEIGRLLKFKNQFQKEHGRDPDYDEFLGAFPQHDTVKIKAMLDDARDIISLDTPVGDDGETLLVDLLGDTRHSNPVEDIIEQDTLDWIQRLIDETIDGGHAERDRFIVRARFGLSGDKVWTLRDLSRELGLSPERVRQIERAGLLKLRTALSARESA